MELILFWTFATLMLGFALAVILMRSPVSSALCLVVSFICLAALFIMLDARFLGVVQVLVYAGAIMVLFLFIIMLLDLKAESLRNYRLLATLGGILAAGALTLNVVVVTNSYPTSEQPKPEIDWASLPYGGDDVQMLGRLLFDVHVLPLTVIALLIFVASVGVVILSKRELE